MKTKEEEINPLTSFHYYTLYIREALNRLLTKEEVKVIMSRYIKGTPVDVVINELNKEK